MWNSFETIGISQKPKVSDLMINTFLLMPYGYCLVPK